MQENESRTKTENAEANIRPKQASIALELIVKVKSNQ